MLGLRCCVGFFWLCGAEAYSIAVGCGLLIAGASVISSRVRELQWLWLPGSRAQAQWLGSMGLVAPSREGSSQIRNHTRSGDGLYD